MSDIKEDLIFKINEAKFHIELLDTLEQTGKPLTHQNNVEAEASYILSAILNSFYSVMELSGKNKDQAVSNFKQNSPAIYGNASKGGLRNKTVHVSHVKIDHLGYVPSTEFNFRYSPKLVIEERERQNQNVFNFTENFYIEIDGKLTNVVDFCAKHLYKLESFIKNKHDIS